MYQGNLLLKNFDPGSLSGKKVAIKANYNSQDPFPASTHIGTLSAIVDALKKHDIRPVLAGKKGFDVVILDELKSNDWLRGKRQPLEQGIFIS